MVYPETADPSDCEGDLDGDREMVLDADPE